MRSIAWGVVVACCGALLGCASDPDRYMVTTPCTEANCFVHVIVSDCTIIAAPEERQVARENRSPVIHWELDAASFVNYAIAEDGITFGDAGREQFHTPQRSRFGKEFTVVDNNTAPGKYKYTIKVVRRWGNHEACPAYDPWVVNN